MSQEKTDQPKITIGEVYKKDGHRAVDILIDGQKVGMSYVEFGAASVSMEYSDLLERAGGIAKVREMLKRLLAK